MCEKIVQYSKKVFFVSTYEWATTKFLIKKQGSYFMLLREMLHFLLKDTRAVRADYLFVIEVVEVSIVLVGESPRSQGMLSG